jgi:hypothetical protein
MVAMTIIGIAVALTIPKIANIDSQTKVQRAVQAMRMETQQAFAIAGRNRAPITLRWISGTMQFQSTNLANTTVYRRLSLGNGSGYGFSSSEITVYPTVLTVFPNGLAADTLFIKVSRKGFSQMVRLSRSGMVKTR